jgi:exopolysaccharide biosynthesis WecB/TagA/CpsF family protein
MYKLSILTVVKNNYREIDLTIKSIISQSIKEKELIIVDGFSTDGTWEIIEKYTEKYPFIKSFKKKDNNLYEALNFGINKATGEYLHLLHSGDFYYSKNSLQNLYNFAKSKLLDATYSPVIYFNKEFKIVREWKTKKEKEVLFSNIPHTSLFLSKKIYKKFFYPTTYKIAGDTYFIYKLKEKVKKISLYNKPIIFMNSSGLSTNLNFFITKFTEDIMIFYKIYKFSFIFFYCKKIFSKISQFFLINVKNSKRLKKILVEIDYKNYFTTHLKKKIIINFNYNIKMKKFILSAFNIAFIGSLMQRKISLQKNLFFWPDGISINFFQKKIKIKKMPGRYLIENFVLPNYINDIVIIGNLSKLSKIYISKKFINKKISHINLPYSIPYNLYNLLPKFKSNQLILLTISTPKQELLAEFIYDNNEFCKIICIGGALEMLSGNEKKVPDFLYEKNLEFLWRLRYDTMRRLRRLFVTALYSLKFYLFGYKIVIKL